MGAPFRANGRGGQGGAACDLRWAGGRWDLGATTGDRLPLLPDLPCPIIRFGKAKPTSFGQRGWRLASHCRFVCEKAGNGRKRPLADACVVGEKVKMAEVAVAQKNGERSARIRSAWLRWLLLFIPFMALILLTLEWLDFFIVMTGLLVMAVGVSLYQRHVNKRSWRSIMLGVYAESE
jgi:hypothetical protein